MSEEVGVVRLGDLIIDFINKKLIYRGKEMQVGGAPGVVSGWELLKRIDVESDTQEFVVDGLNGDDDEVYLILFVYNNSYSDRAVVVIYPNDDRGTNYMQSEVFVDNTETVKGIYADGYSGLLLTGKPLPGNGVSQGFAYLFAKSGKRRVLLCDHYEDHPNGLLGVRGLAVWKNTTDNITKMVFSCPQGAGIGAGSWFEIWRRKRS